MLPGEAWLPEPLLHPTTPASPLNGSFPTASPGCHGDGPTKARLCARAGEELGDALGPSSGGASSPSSHRRVLERGKEKKSRTVGLNRDREVFVKSLSKIAAQKHRRLHKLTDICLTMAAVDSFSFLLREIGKACSCVIETLAFIGAFYIMKTSLTVASNTYTLVRLYFIPRLITRRDLVKLYGNWAAVTGCTSGIGKSYAKELACHGVNVVLISRNKEMLEALAKDIEDSYKVETEVIVVDFSRGRQVYPAIKKALVGKEIGILVNSVGVFYDHPDYFVSLTEDKIWDLINVNIGAANMMVHMVLPGMVQRKKGAIVNVSSMASYQPSPQMTAYSASKAYLDHFSRSLYYEYAPQGIFVQSLTPGFICTSMTKYSSTLLKKSLFVPSADEYAHQAIATLGLSKRTPGYSFHSIQGFFGQIIPEWLWVWGVSRIGSL